VRRVKKICVFCERKWKWIWMLFWEVGQELLS
jgi:hypothetical protein